MEPKYWNSSGGHSNNNPMLAITYKGIFAGTFVNSFGIRSFSLGVQRYWFETSSAHKLRYALGYRLGLIQGYGGLTRQPYRFFCYNQPFLPFAQLVSNLTYQHVGVELGFTMNVLSGSAYLRF
jgi:hypothetical protein